MDVYIILNVVLYDYECREVYDYEGRSYMTTTVAGLMQRMPQLYDYEGRSHNVTNGAVHNATNVALHSATNVAVSNANGAVYNATDVAGDHECAFRNLHMSRFSG